MSLVEIARLFAFVHEAQIQNTGLWVEAIQLAAGGQKGDSWCMEFVWDMVCIASQGKPPFDRVQAVQDFRMVATRNGWLVDGVENVVQVGDLCLSVDPVEDHAHHIGIVTVVDPLTTIAGNTDATGASSNGDGVHEHPVNPQSKVFVRVPL